MNSINTQTPETSERLSGVLVDWQDSRGFGWVEVKGKRSFVHVREFGGTGRRPRNGDEVTFIAGKDPKGRDCALELRFQGGGRLGMRPGSWIFLLALLVLPLAAGLKLSGAPWIIGAWLLMASRMSWLQYSFDKERARADMARLSEATLLGADLLGGWPGGFLAQVKLRHKTRKWRFQLAYWMFVVLWQAAAFELLTGLLRTYLRQEWGL